MSKDPVDSDTSTDDVWDVDDRIARGVVPLLERRLYREAHTHLLSWLEELPRTPFHGIGKLKITDSLRKIAALLDEFLAEASAREPVCCISTCDRDRCHLTLRSMVAGPVDRRGRPRTRLCLAPP